MKPLPFILAAVAVVLLVRVGLRRKGRKRSSKLEGLTLALRDRRLLGDAGLVAGREIRERLRGRLFRVVTLILFAVVAAAVVIPTLHKATHPAPDGRRRRRSARPRHRAARAG